MATISKQYTFSTGTTIVASEVNTNFDDLFTQVNDELIHADGTNAFTALISGPATDPTADNHLARKKYVDDQIAAVTDHKTGFAATKASASGYQSSDGWTTFGAVTEQFDSDTAFNGTSVFTAPKAGMWLVWFTFDGLGTGQYNWFGRVTSNYSGWGSPELKSGAFGEDGDTKRVNVSGLLPCDSGGTLTFNHRNSATSNKSATDIYLGAVWFSGIPT